MAFFVSPVDRPMGFGLDSSGPRAAISCPGESNPGNAHDRPFNSSSLSPPCPAGGRARHAGAAARAGCQARLTEAPGDTRQTLDRLLLLIDARLAVAEDVAKAKWNSGDPIDAPAREDRILQQVVIEASQSGVDEAFAQTFFKHQFEASKVIQHRLHDRWKQAQRPAFADPPDLAEDIRPRLDRLTPQLIASLRDFQRVARDATAGPYLERRAEALTHGDDEQAWRLALRPLFEATGD